jgi:hypothetical protein
MKTFEWISPMLERSKNEIAPDTLRDILSASKAHRTDNSKRIKTLQFAT